MRAAHAGPPSTTMDLTFHRAPHEMSEWKPSAAMKQLQARADILSAIRHYFYRQSVTEVETPMLSRFATVDPHIDSFVVDMGSVSPQQPNQRFLQTSPEFPMKRLLCAGSGDIYFLGRVFRKEEQGRRHNPEFTMLEWYRLDMDHHQLMDDVTRMLNTVTPFQEARRCTYRELFEHHLGVDPHRATDRELEELVATHVDSSLARLTRNDCLDLLFSTCIEPHLGTARKAGLVGVYVYDYPASMAALAAVATDALGESVAQRFELFVNGVELVNGYRELTDWREQEARFANACKSRKQSGKTLYPYDSSLIDGMRHGLPDCAGVAMGVDRLHMLIADVRDIKEVIPFGFDRA